MRIRLFTCLAVVLSWLSVGLADARVAARASSIHPGPYAPGNAVDGNPRTRWASALSRDGRSQWLQIDFGAARPINNVSIHWETAHATEYKIQVHDGRAWSTIHHRRGGRGGKENISGLSARARSLRVLCMRYDPRFPLCSIWELKVTGAAARSAARASSVHPGPYAPGNAVDGNPGTRWASALSRDGRSQWLQIDFGAARPINNVSIHWETAHATEYKIQVHDGRAWSTIHHRRGGRGGKENISGLSARARSLRVLCLRYDPRFPLCSIWELKVTGDRSAPGPGARRDSRHREERARREQQRLERQTRKNMAPAPGRTFSHVGTWDSVQRFQRKPRASSRPCYLSAFMQCQKTRGWGADIRHIFLIDPFQAYTSCGSSFPIKKADFARIVGSASTSAAAAYRQWCLSGHVEHQDSSARQSASARPFASSRAECRKPGVTCHVIRIGR